MNQAIKAIASTANRIRLVEAVRVGHPYVESIRHARREIGRRLLALSEKIVVLETENPDYADPDAVVQQLVLDGYILTADQLDRMLSDAYTAGTRAANAAEASL